MLTQTRTKTYKSRYADDKQNELYTKFPRTSFLGDKKNVDHVLKWNTFFRRNLHRLAIDYLGINLHPYQALTLYLMGICQFVVISNLAATLCNAILTFDDAEQLKPGRDL